MQMLMKNREGEYTNIHCHQVSSRYRTAINIVVGLTTLSSDASEMDTLKKQVKDYVVPAILLADGMPPINWDKVTFLCILQFFCGFF